MPLTLEIGGTNDFGPCSCCGNNSRTVWGSLHDSGTQIASYFVHWTLGRLDHGANFDLVIGPWGDNSTAAERAIAAVSFRQTETGPGFMIIDAESRPIAKRGVLAKMVLRREQVVGTPMAKAVFELLDLIWLKDLRIRELHGEKV